MALKVNEIVKVEVEASDGQVLKEGDAIMLRINQRTPGGRRLQIRGAFKRLLCYHYPGRAARKQIPPGKH